MTLCGFILIWAETTTKPKFVFGFPESQEQTVEPNSLAGVTHLASPYPDLKLKK